MTLCKVCNHPEVNRINEMLVAGTAAREVARQFDDLNHVSVSRHKNKHLPKHLLQAKTLQQESAADDLLIKIETIYTRAWGIVDLAEADGKFQPAVAALKEARACLELIGRLLGELRTGNTYNFLYNPEFIQVRAIITEALLPYPEAREAVVQALDAEVIEVADKAGHQAQS